MTASPKNLNHLFHGTLKDIYFAEKKIVATLPKMAKAATSPDLKLAFQKHLTQSEGHVKRLEEIFGMIDAKPQAKTCDAIMGIVKEGESLIAEYKGSPALDAALLAVAQAVEHYEICRYGTMRVWAEELGMPDAAELFKETLDEEHACNDLLTKIAEGALNVASEHPKAFKVKKQDDSKKGDPPTGKQAKSRDKSSGSN